MYNNIDIVYALFYTKSLKIITCSPSCFTARKFIFSTYPSLCMNLCFFHYCILPSDFSYNILLSLALMLWNSFDSNDYLMRSPILSSCSAHQVPCRCKTKCLHAISYLLLSRRTWWHAQSHKNVHLHNISGFRVLVDDNIIMIFSGIENVFFFLVCDRGKNYMYSILIYCSSRSSYWNTT